MNDNPEVQKLAEALYVLTQATSFATKKARDGHAKAVADLQAALAQPAPQVQEAVANPNESIEYTVVQDGCEQYGASTLEEAQGWANANGPWALSIYEVKRTCLVSCGKPLPAAPASPPGWEPIETAPMDGTVFLAWRRGHMAEAYRVPRDDCEMWAFGNESGAFEYYPSIKPSHWMPAPHPPGDTKP